MFNVEKVFTCLNADEVKPGSLGYFADDLETLERMVSSGKPLRMLEKINGKKAMARFRPLNENSYCLFYLVKQPSKSISQPYASGAELLADFESKQHPLYIFDNDTKDCVMITRITDTGVYLNSELVSFSDLLFHFSFKNGDPVGVKNDK